MVPVSIGLLVEWVVEWEELMLVGEWQEVREPATAMRTVLCLRCGHYYLFRNRHMISRYWNENIVCAKSP